MAGVSTKPATTGRRARLAVVIVAIAVLVMALVGFFALRVATDALHRATRDRARSSAILNARIVLQETQRLSDLAGVLARNSELVRALHDRDPGALDRVARDARASGDSLRLAFIADSRGRLLAAAPRDSSIIGRDFSYRDWYRGAMLHSPYVSNVYRTAAFGHQKVYAAASVVRDAHGKVIGVVGLAQARQLQSFVDRYEQQYGQRLTVVDRVGTIVAESGHASDRLHTSRDAALARALDGTSSTHLQRGRGVLTAVEPVQSLGWAVKSELSTAASDRTIRGIQRTLLVLVSFAGLALLGLLGLSYRLLGNLERSERRDLVRAGAIREGLLRNTRVTAESERHRVAADLHDYVLQHLHASKMHLEHVNTTESLSPEGSASLTRALELLSDSTASTRRIMTGIEPLHIEAIGLTRALEALATSVARDYPMAVETSIDLAPLESVPESEGATTLYRIIGELLVNAAKHSGAAKATLLVTSGNDGVIVTVSDDGAGFLPAVGGIDGVDALDTSITGMGLVSVFDRVQLLGGSCRMASTMGRGTTIVITIPTSSLEASDPLGDTYRAPRSEDAQ